MIYNPDGHQGNLQALNKGHQLDPYGLLARFYQSGCFRNMVKQPKIVGRMEPTFGPFEPS